MKWVFRLLDAFDTLKSYAYTNFKISLSVKSDGISQPSFSTKCYFVLSSCFYSKSVRLFQPENTNLACLLPGVLIKSCFGHNSLYASKGGRVCANLVLYKGSVISVLLAYTKFLPA